MRIFLLTWNPDKWVAPEQVQESIETTAAGYIWPSNWSVGGRKGGIEEGDLALLLRQHRDRGIVASGMFTSPVYQDEHWNHQPGKEANYADVAFDTWLPAEDGLSVDALKLAVPEVTWDRLQASGVQAPDSAAVRLLELWDDHLSTIGWGKAVIPEEFDRTETFPEGAASSIEVNRYERDPRARQACIDKWGYKCSVCGFDFEARYGDLGKGYIHVHHLTDLSTVGVDYEVDPVNDLCPVCPNCHAMLHRGSRPARGIEDLKRCLTKQLAPL